MTDRDKFAIEILNGYISCSETNGSPEELVRYSYEIADLMLKARKVSDDYVCDESF